MNRSASAPSTTRWSKARESIPRSDRQRVGAVHGDHRRLLPGPLKDAFDETQLEDPMQALAEARGMAGKASPSR